MKPHRRVFVVGGAHSTYLGRGHPDFVHRRHPDHGRRENPGLAEHLATAVGGAFAHAGVEAGEVDKAYVSNFLGECFVRQGHLGAALVDAAPGLAGKPVARIEAACASGSAAIAACIDALQAGCDVTLAAGVEIETNVPGREGVDYMARAAHYEKSRALGQFTFPAIFARRAKRYKEAFGATDLDLARVVVKAYGNAARNPLALMRAVQVDLEAAMTPGEHNALFLEDEALRPHMKMLDCTGFTDGASAVLLATEAGLVRLGLHPSRCTEILAYGHTVQALAGAADPTELTNVRRAAQIAYADAGIGPTDLDVAEIHDCFSITELQMYEAIGIAGPGGAPALLRDGATAIDGSIPVNTGGGLIGFGHPIGATGIKQVFEVYRQMKGECGDYQMPTPPRHGLTANLGGDDRTAIVMVQRNC